MSVPDAMSGADLDIALAYMQASNEIDPSSGLPYPTNLPYGVFPGQAETDIVPLHDRHAWTAYRWNPPEFSGHDESQPNCAAKPTWEALVGYAIAARRDQAIARLRTACAARITQGYGERTSAEELQFRLRAAEPDPSPADQTRLTHGNTERDRLRTRYQTIHAWIHTLTDLDQLTNLDFTSPDYWSPDWTPPA